MDEAMCIALFGIRPAVVHYGFQCFYGLTGVDIIGLPQTKRKGGFRPRTNEAENSLLGHLNDQIPEWRSAAAEYRAEFAQRDEKRNQKQKEKGREKKKQKQKEKVKRQTGRK